MYPDRGLDAALEAGLKRLAEAGIEPEYFEARYPGTLDPATDDSREPILVAVAAPVDGTRLIDNILIEPTKQARSTP